MDGATGFFSAGYAVDAFALYAALYPDEIAKCLPSSSPHCLLDYLDAWIWQDCTGTTGLLMCRNDFGLFLSTVALAIDRWHVDPTFGHKELEMFKGFPSACGYLGAKHPVFDPRNFQQAWFQWEHVAAVSSRPSPTA